MQIKLFTATSVMYSLLAAATLGNGQLTNDWLAGVSPCVRKCANAAAVIVGCDINDIACLCRNREAFLNLVRQCLRNNLNCPVLSINPVPLICPIVPTLTLTIDDPLPTLATGI